MSIQSDVNYLLDKLIKEEAEKAKQNKELADKILGESMQTSNALIEEVKKQQIINELIASEELTEEEKNYCQSPYFQNYLQFIKDGIDVVAKNIQNDIIVRYNYNNCYFKNPFYKEIETKQLLYNIGFPVPAKFIDKIGMLIVGKLDEMKLEELLGVDCEISITSHEYEASVEKNSNLKSGNVIKKSDSYIVTVKAKQMEDIKDKQLG